jgi:hypothetical protein
VQTVKKSAPAPAGIEPYRVVAVGDTIIGEQGLVAIIGRDPRYQVCGAAHTFDEANELGISRKTVESHCEHIKVKLAYPDAETLHRGARDLLGTTERPARNP